MDYTLETFSSVLAKILSPEVIEISEQYMAEPGSKDSGFIQLPEGNQGLDIENISRLIALASNQYGLACRRASLARAEYKIAYARYKNKFRMNMGSGKSQAEREVPAAIAAAVDYDKMVLLESIVELCTGIEDACRIASESARRMLLAADQAHKAEMRLDTYSGSLKDTDFSPF